MSRKDLFLLAVRNLLRRRARTLLAVIGVVVGTCAIVVMLSIGFGLSVSFQEQIESYGNLHLVNVYGSGGGMGYYEIDGGVSVGSYDKDRGVLNDKAIAKFEKLPGVDAATPTLSEYLTFGIGKYVCSTQVLGIRPEVMQKFSYETEEGRLLQAGDKFNLVFGSQVPIQFYNPAKTMYSSWSGEASVDVVTDKMVITADDMYGQKRRQQNQGEEKINYKEYKGKGVGILKQTNDESDYQVFMNLDTLQSIQADSKRARKESGGNSSKQTYEQAMLYVGDINDVETVSEAIRDMGFQTSSLNDWLKSMQDTAKMIQGILGGIGAISLFVAALGITNTMIMSIYERTREIGVMKVIGANLKDIRGMFLLEAGLIGFIGGCAGLALSFLISLLMNTVLAPVMSTLMGNMMGGGSTISVIPWWVAAGSLGFATAIGILSGYYPARRAMRLSALESLKNE